MKPMDTEGTAVEFFEAEGTAVEVGFNEYVEGAAAGSNEDRKEVTKKGHGGWMPKCVKLCQAYNKGKWWKVEQLITDFQYSSTVFASMLNRGVKDD